ncbi:MAG: DMT family transporter [Rhizobiaceae bacterium]
MSEHSPSSDGSNPTLGLILGLLGVLIFAGTLPATRIAVEFYNAGFLTFGRALVAGIAAIFCLAALRKSFPRKHLWALLFSGLALVFGFPGFMTLAMVTVPASHGGVVLGILPLGTAIFATLWAGERPSLLFWLCGVIGAVLIVIFTLRDGGWGFAIGDLWLLVAGVTASAGYVIAGKLSHHMPGWEVICWSLVLFLPVSALGCYFFWQPGYEAVPSPQAWAFGYVAMFSMLIGFFAWNTGLRMGGIAKVGQLQLLQTFFTLGIAAVVVGEQITMETIGFAVAVLIVVLVGRKAQVTR